MVNSCGLPRLIGPVTSCGVSINAHQSVDQVVDVTERSGLGAVAVDRQRPAGQGRHDEVGYDAAVVRTHARAVGVEDPSDLDRHVVLAAVVEEQRLGAPLALVVAGPDTDRVDVAPVALVLRVYFRVAVHLGGGGQQDPRLRALGQAQHVDGSDHGRLRRLDWVASGRTPGTPGRPGGRSRPPRRTAGRSHRAGPPPVGGRAITSARLVRLPE